MKLKKKRNPNLSKYDAPLRIQFERGIKAFRGRQYIRNAVSYTHLTLPTTAYV